jgi:trimethylamine---corrinoid protein Co-methyltransferase
VTDMDTAAGEGLRRRRGGGREGHARNAAPQQPPWAQPRMRYRPTEVVSADELEAIHIGSLRVLSEIGMDFLDADAREILRAAGAQTQEGSLRVRFDPAMVTELIRTAPAAFTLHAWNPEHDLQLGILAVLLVLNANLIRNMRSMGSED